MSRYCLADDCNDQSVSRGAATPDTDVLFALCRASLADLAERVDRFEDDRCRRADIGMIDAPDEPGYAYSGRG